MTQKHQHASPGLRRSLITAVTLIMLALLCTAPAAAEDPVKFGGGYFVTVQNLANALGDAVTMDRGILVLEKDIELTGTIWITCEMTIVGNGHTIYRGGEGFPLIGVQSGTLILGSYDPGDTLTIDGQGDRFPEPSSSNSPSSSIYVTSGHLVMKDGVTLKNSITYLDKIVDPYYYGSAVTVSKGATFTMEGGLITQNTVVTADTAKCGAVTIDPISSFRMFGGTISGNTASGVMNAGTFTMSGGTISGNTATVGGGVHNYQVAHYQGTFSMSGGTISSNTAIDGGGVHNAGTFSMSGGTISGNTASGTGDELYHTGSGFLLSGPGAISGGTLYLNGTRTITLDGALSRSGGIQNIVTSDPKVNDIIVTTRSSEDAKTARPYFTLDSSLAKDYGLIVSGNNIVLGEYTVTYNGNGNSGGSVPTDPNSYKPNASVTVAEKGDLEKTDHTFAGWNTKADGRGTAYNEGAAFSINEDTTLYAQWHNGILPPEIAPTTLSEGVAGTPYEEVKLKATGTVPFTWTIAGGTLPNGLTLSTEGIIRGTPTTAGTFTFIVRAANDYPTTDVKELSITIASNPNPGPKPPQPPASSGSGSANMENSFRVLFDTKGGSFISPATGLSYGDTISQPPAPTKDGYTFGGWYKDSACTQTWNFSDGIPGDITLYAKWNRGSSTDPTPIPTAPETTKPTTVPETTKPTTVPETHPPTAIATTAPPVTATSKTLQPTLTQAPAPILGALLGLLAAGVLLRRKD